MDDFKSLIGKVATGATLSRDEAANAFDHMMSGEATPSQMGGLLMGLRLRETLQRSLTDEQVAQYVTKIESEIGTSINQAAFAQVTGASSN